MSGVVWFSRFEFKHRAETPVLEKNPLLCYHHKTCLGHREMDLILDTEIERQFLDHNLGFIKPLQNWCLSKSGGDFRDIRS